MARLGGVVIPGMPHHVTQRGNRRQQTFFNDGNYATYVDGPALLTSALREEELADLRACGRTGRPFGSATLVERLEGIVGRILRPPKGGRPAKFRSIPNDDYVPGIARNW